MHLQSISEFAPAKINVSLSVRPLGTDGYHPIQSLVQFADIGDTLCFEAAGEIRLQITGPFAEKLKADASNLVLQSAHALAQELGNSDKGAHIHLCKNLPIASGIGGGSADAAAALRGLNRLWNGGLSDAQLANIGAQFGADIAACVYGQTLQMSGRGETIDLLPDQPEFCALLVYPGFSLSTKQVFARFDEMNPNPQAQIGANDLLPAALSIAPQLKGVLEKLQHVGLQGQVHLCGSGPTFFIQFANWNLLQEAKNTLRKTSKDWWIKKTWIGRSHQY